MANATTQGLTPALRALAALLHYPDAALQEHAGELADVIAAQPQIPADDRSGLERLAQRLRTTDLLHLQADYVETFDRSKKVSLYLFEHVHGESRDRGQAMVELRMAYREHGLEMDSNELPDYLPLFLEFCSVLADKEAYEWLEDISHILQGVHVRLSQRDSGYALPMRLLLRLVQVDPWPPELMHEAAGEKRDDTREAIDAAWREAPVTFDAGSALGACRSVSQCGEPSTTPSSHQP